eukprot:1671192-Rhodomonas_salina.3
MLHWGPVRGGMSGARTCRRRWQTEWVPRTPEGSESGVPGSGGNHEGHALSCGRSDVLVPPLGASGDRGSLRGAGLADCGEAREGPQLSLLPDALLIRLQGWGTVGDGVVQGIGTEGSAHGGTG